jgi:hypothetical protein
MKPGRRQVMMFRKRGLLATGLAVIPISCATTASNAPDPRVVTCLVFDPHEWDESLPEYYIRQTKGYNAKLLSLCPEKRPEPVTKE